MEAPLASLAALVALAMPIAAAQLVERDATALEVAVDSGGAPIRVGDVVALVIATHGASAAVSRDADLGAFERAGEPVIFGAGEGELIVRIPVRTFATGALMVPSFGVTVDSVPMATRPISLHVVAISSADASPQSAKLLLADPRSSPLTPVLFALLVVAAIGVRVTAPFFGRRAPSELAVVRALRASPRRPIARGPSQVPSPRVVALARLASEVGGVGPSSDARTFLESIKRIATTYTVARYGLDRRERTTRELVGELERAIPRARLDALTRILRACDTGEFASLDVPLEHALEIAARLERFIRSDERETAGTAGGPATARLRSGS